MVPSIKLHNGYSFPILGLGTFNAKPNEVEEAVKNAIDVGYRHFDCALRYGNETEIGAGIRAKLAEGCVQRDNLFITSKLWNTHHRPDLVLPACRKTLSDMGLDYLDLYLVHWPFAVKEGTELKPVDSSGRVIPSDVDYVDTWRAMEDCVKLGLVRSIGLSNFSIEQIQRVLDMATIKPAVHQVEYHPYLKQSPVVAFSKENNMALTAHSPLGSPGSNAKPDTPYLLGDPRLKPLTDKYKKTAAQVVLRYLVQNGVAAIPKSVNRQHLVENFDIFDFEITADEIAYIDTFDQNIRICKYIEARDHKDYPFKSELS